MQLWTFPFSQWIQQLKNTRNNKSRKLRKNFCFHILKLIILLNSRWNFFIFSLSYHFFLYWFPVMICLVTHESCLLLVVLPNNTNFYLLYSPPPPPSRFQIIREQKIECVPENFHYVHLKDKAVRNNYGQKVNFQILNFFLFLSLVCLFVSVAKMVKGSNS